MAHDEMAGRRAAAGLARLPRRGAGAPAGLEAQLQDEADMPHGLLRAAGALSEAPDRRLRMSALADAAVSSAAGFARSRPARAARGGCAGRPAPPTGAGRLAVLTDDGFAALAAAAPGHVAAVRRLLVDRLTRSSCVQLRAISEAISAV
jgi:hypothetical protein